MLILIKTQKGQRKIDELETTEEEIQNSPFFQKVSDGIYKLTINSGFCFEIDCGFQCYLKYALKYILAFFHFPDKESEIKNAIFKSDVIAKIKIKYSEKLTNFLSEEKKRSLKIKKDDVAKEIANKEDLLFENQELVCFKALSVNNPSCDVADFFDFSKEFPELLNTVDLSSFHD
jgi:hypothetical protein